MGRLAKIRQIYTSQFVIITVDRHIKLPNIGQLATDKNSFIGAIDLLYPVMLAFVIGFQRR